jgi:hypothetical protein
MVVRTRGLRGAFEGVPRESLVASKRSRTCPGRVDMCGGGARSPACARREAIVHFRTREIEGMGRDLGLSHAWGDPRAATEWVGVGYACFVFADRREFRCATTSCHHVLSRSQRRPRTADLAGATFLQHPHTFAALARNGRFRSTPPTSIEHCQGRPSSLHLCPALTHVASGTLAGQPIATLSG